MCGVTALVSPSIAFATTGVTPVAVEGPQAPCGTVLLSGSAWLFGHGVDIHSNGVDQYSGNSCGGLGTGSPRVLYGYGYQCVELAARLYHALGWGLVYANGPASAGQYRYGAKYIPEGSPKLQFHSVASDYVPVPGDLLIEGGTQWGHVAVVDYVTSNVIATVEQNASNTAWHYYSVSHHHITGGYNPVRGFMHAPKNHFTNVSVPNDNYETVFVANTQSLYSLNSAGASSLHGYVAASTTPAAIARPAGGYRVAYVGTNGDVIVGDFTGALDTRTALLGGTNVSLATTSTGLEVAFVGANGDVNLGTADTPVSSGPVHWVTTDFNVAALPLTSPALVVTPAGPEVAYVGTNGDLWIASSPGVTSDTGVVVAAGTSPAGALRGNGDVEFVVTGTNGHVWTDVRGVISDTGVADDITMTPTITSTHNGGAEVAYVTPDHHAAAFGALGSHVWTNVTTTTSVGIASGVHNTFEVAVNTDKSQLWLATATTVRSTTLGLRAGTPPSILAI